MRIVYATPRYLPYLGGTEIHTAAVATRMAARGHDVTVLATDPKGHHPPNEVLDGVQVRRVPAWPAERDYYLAPQVRRDIATGKWDLVHVQGYHTAFAPLAMSGSVQGGHPFVLTFHSGGHSSVVRRALRPLQHRLLERLARHAERLIGVSAWETAHFVERLRIPSERFVTIPNGVDLGPMRSSPAEDNADSLERHDTAASGAWTVASIGRIERYKGHQDAIAAMPRLRELLPEARLLIVGRGPYEEELHRLAVKRGVADIVEFTSVPAGDRAAMQAIVRSSALVVSMSRYESQGLSVHEALALGRPVLVADATALGELAGLDGVLAVPPRCSPEALAVAMLQAMRDHEPSPGARSAEMGTWDDITDALEDLYDTILAGRS